MSVAKRIAVNSIYQLGGKFITLGISLVLVALLARKLGVASYGVYTTALAYSQLYAILADLGIGVYLLKRLSAAEKLGENEEKIVGSVTEVRVLTAVLGSLVALAVTYFLPYDNVQRQAIAVAIVAVILQMLNTLYVAVLQSQLEMRFAAVSEVLGRLVTFGGVVLALYWNLGIAAVFVAQIVGNGVNLIITYYLSHRFVKPRFERDVAHWQMIVKNSLVIGLSSVLSYIYFKMDTFLLSILPIAGKTNDVEVGLYGSAYKVIEILVIIPGVFLGTIFPLFTAAMARKDTETARLLTDRAFQVMLGVSLTAATALLIFAQPIIHFIAGSEFGAAALPLQILGVAVPFNFLGSVFLYSLLALEKQKLMSYLYAGAAIFNVIVNVLTIPHYSYVAAAWTTVATEVVVFVGSAFIMMKIFPLRLRIAESLAITCCIVGSGLFTYLVPAEYLLVRIVAFTALLLGTVALFYKKLLLKPV